MGGVGPSDAEGRLEHAVEALIPPVRRRAGPPEPLVVPPLPPPATPGMAEALVLDVARLDASGRFTSRVLMGALRWRPGQRLELIATDHGAVFTPAADGRQAVGRRGELAVPVSARVSAGLDHEAQVLLVAAPGRAMLLVHSIALVARLLTAHYARQDEVRDGG